MLSPLEIAKTRFSGKKVLVFGLGLLGGAAGDARFFATLGADVRVTDMKTDEQLAPTLDRLKDIRLSRSLGGHLESDIDWADVIVRNPSVRMDHPLLVRARQMGKRIIMRTALFVELAGVETIGITGTRGKTTTTEMVYDIVSELSGKKVLLGGNVSGVSDLELLSQVYNPGNTIAILELSSWQLQGFAENRISPHIAVITNLYPDHLNVYPDISAYYADKHSILRFQNREDFAVLNDSQPEFHEWAATAAGQIRWFKSSGLPEGLRLSVPGEHNRDNAAAAMAVAQCLGISADACVPILNRFTGVPYRLQNVGIKNGITFINDTTATTPIAATVALNTVDVKPVLICGGADKNLPVDTFAAAVNEKAKIVVLIRGNGSDRLKPMLRRELIAGEAGSMDEAFRLAVRYSSAGDIVLLSPGFASFGIFNNEFDRGDQFNRCVHDLP